MLILSEIFYSWMVRTKLHRQLLWTLCLGTAAYILQHQLYTNTRPWYWWLELVGFVLCLIPCTVLGGFALKTVGVGLFAPPARALAKLPWDRIVGVTFFISIGITAYSYANLDAADHAVASATGACVGVFLLISSIAYFVHKLTDYGPRAAEAGKER